MKEEFIKLCKQDLTQGIHYKSTQEEDFKEDMGEIADW